jgi:hypothetical protein
VEAGIIVEKGEVGRVKGSGTVLKKWVESLYDISDVRHMEFDV